METELLEGNISVDVASLKSLWMQKTEETFSEANTVLPEKNICSSRWQRRNAHRAAWLHTCRNAVYTKSLSKFNVVRAAP
jgi:hypothetical protein